jgi:tRNA threonylcarbamoyladenosine biosynthesis protein TsaE
MMSDGSASKLQTAQPPHGVITRSDAETEALARKLAERLEAGARIHLYGDLGAGKTVFVRGLAEGLGVDPDEVTSPTFTLIQEYRGRLPLYHVDLYRIAPAEVHDLGLDAIAADGVLAVEWAERLPAADSAAIRVHLEDLGDHERRVTIEST